MKIAKILTALVTFAMVATGFADGSSALGAAQQEDDFTIPKDERILLYANKKLAAMESITSDLWLFHSNQLKALTYNGRRVKFFLENDGSLWMRAFASSVMLW